MWEDKVGCGVHTLRKGFLENKMSIPQTRAPQKQLTYLQSKLSEAAEVRVDGRSYSGTEAHYQTPCFTGPLSLLSTKLMPGGNNQTLFGVVFYFCFFKKIAQVTGKLGSRCRLAGSGVRVTGFTCTCCVTLDRGFHRLYLSFLLL